MKFSKLMALSITLSTISSYANSAEVYLNLQTPKSSSSSIEINVNKSKINEDLIKLITLDGITSTKNIEDIKTNKNSFGKYFLSGDEKFSQSNITSAYSDYSKAIIASAENDFQALLLAYKFSNIGFFTLSQYAINQIEDSELYKKQTSSIKDIFFPEVTLSYDEEIFLAELYADIYYNNLALETIKELNKNASLLKKSDYANYILAQAYFEAGKYNKAINSINKALNIKKKSPIYLQYKAKILCETQNYKDALKILDKIKQSSINMDKFAQSIKAQKEYTLASYYKNTAKSKYHLAKYFSLINETTRAIKEANNSIYAKKKNIEAYTLIGDIQSKLGEFDKANEAYTKALSFNKKYSPALKGLGYIEKRIGTYEKALSYYMQAQKYSKSDIVISKNIIQLLFATGNTEKAKEICNYILLKEPNSSDLYHTMSEIYPEKKEEYLRKAIELNAFNNNAWIDLAEINLTQNIEKAEKYLQSVKISGNQTYKYYYVEGLLNKHNGNITKANESFRNALKLNPNFSQAQKELNTLDL